VAMAIPNTDSVVLIFLLRSPSHTMLARFIFLTPYSKLISRLDGR
jgi:hypothetical protein